MTVAMTPTCRITCPSCGRHRVVSDRNARRRPQTCDMCRNERSRKPPEDKDRRFWLQRFSDEEILRMVFGIFEEEGDIEMVRYWRSVLCPNQKSVDEVLIERVISEVQVKETHELLLGNGKAKLREQVGSADRP